MYEINTPQYSVAICPVILVKMLTWCHLYYAKHIHHEFHTIISPPAQSHHLGSSAIKH